MKIDGGCHCGRVTYQAEIDPEKVSICHCGLDDWGVRWGSIRQRGQLSPRRQIWCRSAVPWTNDLGDLAGRPTD